jgi:peroxiredoxin
VPLVAIALLVIAGQGDPGASMEEGVAPGFDLPDTQGRTVSLDAILQQGDALLYFSMGVGCDGCFAQIPEAIEGLQAQGLQLVPVMVDSTARVAAEASRFGITTPILIDGSREVSEAYGMLGVYGHSDRPSHSFALVHRDGTIGWVKHYETMFVPLDQLLSDMGA